LINRSQLFAAIFWRICCNHLCNQTRKTRVFSACSPVFGSEGLPIVWATGKERRRAASLLAVLNSFALDYVLRQKASGDLNFYVFRQLPALSPKTIHSTAAWDSAG
jgi:hypothetical protein